MDIVTPMLEHVPKRQYRRVGNMISCYKVVCCDSMDMKVEIDSSPLFSFIFVSEDDAIIMMNDLYYGQYSGN